MKGLCAQALKSESRMLFQRPPPSDERLVLKELGFSAARPPGTSSTPCAYDASLHVCERFSVHENENETQRGRKEHFYWGCLDLSRMLCNMSLLNLVRFGHKK